MIQYTMNDDVNDNEIHHEVVIKIWFIFEEYLNQTAHIQQDQRKKGGWKTTTSLK